MLLLLLFCIWLPIELLSYGKTGNAPSEGKSIVQNCRTAIAASVTLVLSMTIGSDYLVGRPIRQAETQTTETTITNETTIAT